MLYRISTVLWLAYNKEEQPERITSLQRVCRKIKVYFVFVFFFVFDRMLKIET